MSILQCQRTVSRPIQYTVCENTLRCRVYVTQLQQEHSECANLRRRQNFNRKWSGIRIRIFGLIRIRIFCQICPKCCGCIILSAFVISPSMGQSGRWLYEKGWQMSKSPLFRNDEEYEKVIRDPHADPDRHQKLITSRGSPLVHVC